MTVRRIPRVRHPEGPDPEPLEADHPMRRVTREVAFEPDAWTPQRAEEVGALFDRLASEWHTRNRPGRLLPLEDALERGGPFLDGPAVELGSGTGIATPTIAQRFSRLIALDLSMEMLRLAPPIAPRVRADARHLPLADASIATLILVNMLLFPVEADRVLASDGALVWVSTAGPETPIYLASDELEAALPGEWEVIASEAGVGTWGVARRALRTSTARR